MKFCRAEAAPISLDTGLADIRDLAIQNNFPEPARKGQVTHRDATDDYVNRALSYIDVSKIPGMDHMAIQSTSSMHQKMIGNVSAAGGG